MCSSGVEVEELSSCGTHLKDTNGCQATGHPGRGFFPRSSPLLARSAASVRPCAARKLDFHAVLPQPKSSAPVTTVAGAGRAPFLRCSHSKAAPDGRHGSASFQSLRESGKSPRANLWRRTSLVLAKGGGPSQREARPSTLFHAYAPHLTHARTAPCPGGLTTAMRRSWPRSVWWCGNCTLRNSSWQVGSGTPVRCGIAGWRRLLAPGGGLSICVVPPPSTLPWLAALARRFRQQLPDHANPPR